MGECVVFITVSLREWKKKRLKKNREEKTNFEKSQSIEPLGRSLRMCIIWVISCIIIEWYCECIVMKPSRISHVCMFFSFQWEYKKVIFLFIWTIVNWIPRERKVINSYFSVLIMFSIDRMFNGIQFTRMIETIFFCFRHLFDVKKKCRNVIINLIQLH